jgi:hypothetical protein
MHPTRLALALALGIVLPVHAQTTSTPVEDVAWGPLCDHARQLIRKLEESGARLPAETTRRLQVLLATEPKDPDMAVRAVQELLDQQCLLTVNINPESRVKAARGSATVQLRQDRPTLVLLKIHNEGGVTHRLRVSGPELIRDRERGEGRWLEADLVTDAPFGRELSGRRLEYRLLRLTPRESGKREATLQFDVGQGTQDLGFRAEVPILFSVLPPRRGG